MRYQPPGNPAKRIKYFAFFLVVVFCAFTWKLFEFQVVKAESINAISKEKRSVTRVIPAVRGQITDSAGAVLARTITRYDINAAPVNVKPISRVVAGSTVEISVDQQAAEVAGVLSMTKEDVLAKIAGLAA